MERLWLPVAMVLLAAVGCVTDEEPQPPRCARSPSNAASAKPQSQITGQIGAHQVNLKHPFDEFKLPLVIRMDAPEVPPEIKRPSPPVEHKDEPSWQFPNPLRLFQQNPKSP
jgi:hypothetical protein